jgi:hypothetical protein
MDLANLARQPTLKNTLFTNLVPGSYLASI